MIIKWKNVSHTKKNQSKGTDPKMIEQEQRYYNNLQPQTRI